MYKPWGLEEQPTSDRVLYLVASLPEFLECFRNGISRAMSAHNYEFPQRVRSDSVRWWVVLNFCKLSIWELGVGRAGPGRRVRRRVLLREASENGHDIQRELHTEKAPPDTLHSAPLGQAYPHPASSCSSENHCFGRIAGSLPAIKSWPKNSQFWKILTFIFCVLISIYHLYFFRSLADLDPLVYTPGSLFT